MSYSILVAITKCHRMSISNNRHLFLTVLEAERPKIKVLVSSGLVRALFLVYRWLPSFLSAYTYIDR
jgi:hypothetical protein